MDARKIIQALTYFACQQPDHQLDNMKAYKLLWLADRFQLRHSGRFISGDRYFAMPFGPVPSDAKNILENKPTALIADDDYVSHFIKTEGKQYKAVAEPDMKVFSISDREILAAVIARFNHLTSLDLSKLSHQFPEWLAYKESIESDNENSSYPIDIDLFFEDSAVDDGGFFADDIEALGLARDLYHQNNHL